MQLHFFSNHCICVILTIGSVRLHVLQVYEMSQRTAQHAWQQRLAYSQAGAILSTGTDGLLSVQQVWWLNCEVQLLIQSELSCLTSLSLTPCVSVCG